MNLPVPATQGPRRTEGSTSGSFAASSLRSRSSPSSESVAPPMSPTSAGEVADLAAGVEQARLLGALRAVAQQFHVLFLLRQTLVQPPSIDVRDAGGEGALVRGEIDRERRHLLRRAEPAHRLAGDEGRALAS